MTVAVHRVLAFAVPRSVELALPVLCLAYFRERPLLAGRESSANWGTPVVIVSVN